MRRYRNSRVPSEEYAPCKFVPVPVGINCSAQLLGIVENTLETVRSLDDLLVDLVV